MADYTLDTGKKYIKEVFAAERFYNVPEYQRPYVWGDEQITNMLDDIANAMEQDSKKEYFLGCMIWNSKKITESGFEYNCEDILDGQQRFITLYLLQGVIRDLSTDRKIKEKVRNRMQQEEDKIDNIPERNRIEFAIRQDKDFIDKFLIEEGNTLLTNQIEEFTKNKDITTSVRNMASAILSIINWLLFKNSQFNNDIDFQNYLNEYYTYLSSKVLVLFLATSDNLDDAYNLFTVLNSRGLQLQASDILKAQNLRVIHDDKLRRKYATRWEEYQNSLESPYKSFDEFLWAIVYVIMKYRSDSNQSLSKAFNYIYERGDLNKGSSTFEFIGRYVDHLEAVTNSNFQSDEAGCYFSNLNYILTTTFGNAYIVLLMHYRECFGENNLLEFLIKIDNLFSISWLTDNRNLQIRIFIILRKMEEIRKENSDKRIASELFLLDKVLLYDYQDEKATTIVNIDLFFQSLNEEKWGSFSGTRINKTRYLLLKLDLLIGNLNTQVYFNKTVSSVEHLMPQKIEGTNWNITEEEHQFWLHKLGNIVLVDRRKNSSLSNSTFTHKKSKYSGYIENRANTNYIFITFQEWNASDIKNNHSRVVNLLKYYYTGNSLKTLKEVKKNNSQLFIL